MSAESSTAGLPWVLKGFPLLLTYLGTEGPVHLTASFRVFSTGCTKGIYG